MRARASRPRPVAASIEASEACERESRHVTQYGRGQHRATAARVSCIVAGQPEIVPHGREVGRGQEGLRAFDRLGEVAIEQQQRDPQAIELDAAPGIQPRRCVTLARGFLEQAEMVVGAHAGQVSEIQ